LGLFLVAVVGASALLKFGVHGHGAPMLTDKDTIVLADFTNTTGDPVFDGTLRQGLAIQLEQSPFLSLVSEERIQPVLRLMGQPRSSIHRSFGALYPIYLRGEAYLTAHQGAEAAAEFQKILDHRGIVVSDPVGAVARLQLGRAFALSGDKTKAKAAYEDFLRLWKDADADIPIFEQAKAEYARLQ